MVDRTRTYAPTQRAWHRVEQLRLSRDLDPDELATEVVDAVACGHSAIRLPKRALAFPLIASIPWRLTDVLLTGVDRTSEGGR
jgi:hypothetical protein